ncbi:MAG TPA: LLM class F420-dependent oxidoreductase [Acidimicrobiales bacterium]|nr:LLM class F420-dependent oxidoreductase [Acidimicrobiales bacterium]
MTAPTGVTLAPLMGLGVPMALDVARTAEALGYDSLWTAEVTGPEAFATLGAVSVAAPSLGLGTGVLALQLRTPPLLAMAGATLGALAAGRTVHLGVGISSPVVAGRWHGAGYGERPLAQVREFVALLRACLSGEKVDFDGDFYRIKGFRLGVRFEQQPQIVIGALNAQMLQLAGEIADGVLLNYLPHTHVPWSVEQVRKGGAARILAYVHVGVGERQDGVEPARRDLFSYATVDSYAANFTRAGYGDAVAEVRERHAAGDRAGALAAVSDDMIDGIDFIGTAEEVAARVRAYREAGVDLPIVFPLPWAKDRAAAVDATLEAAISS